MCLCMCARVCTDTHIYVYVQHIPRWMGRTWILPGFCNCMSGSAKNLNFLQKSKALLFQCITVDQKWEFLFSNSQSLKDRSFYIKMIAFARDLQSN